MLSVKLSERACSALEVERAGRGPSAAVDPRSPLTVTQLRQLFRARTDLRPHQLLAGARILFPAAPPPTQPNPELTARLEKLKREQQDADYARMVRNVDSRFAKTSKASTEWAVDAKALRAQMFAVVNFAVSVVGTFVFFYKAVEYALVEPKVPTQVMAGLLSASIVALAELYFLLRHLDDNGPSFPVAVRRNSS